MAIVFKIHNIKLYKPAFNLQAFLLQQIFDNLFQQF